MAKENFEVSQKFLASHPNFGASLIRPWKRYHQRRLYLDYAEIIWKRRILSVNLGRYRNKRKPDSMEISLLTDVGQKRK